MHRSPRWATYWSAESKSMAPFFAAKGGAYPVRPTWPPNFPPVLVHASWDAPAPRVLSEHPRYHRAKKRRDPQAALIVCEDLCQEATLEHLYDIWFLDDAEAPP